MPEITNAATQAEYDHAIKSHPNLDMRHRADGARYAVLLVDERWVQVQFYARTMTSALEKVNLLNQAECIKGHGGWVKDYENSEATGRGPGEPYVIYDREEKRFLPGRSQAIMDLVW